MTRFDCDTALDSITELARHECEPTYPTEKEAKRMLADVRRRNEAEHNAMMVKLRM